MELAGLIITIVSGITGIIGIYIGWWVPTETRISQEGTNDNSSYYSILGSMEVTEMSIGVHLYFTTL